jgi:GntR family transcriptional regulator
MDATAILAVRYRAQTSEAPKHARLRAAVVDAVRSGELPAGTKIAGERDLSEALGLSLGTTQKALGRLVGDGFLVRRQGHGTFVGSDRQPVSGSWHYRFLDADRRCEMPVFATLLERKVVGADGPWAAALGPDPAGYVMLRRRLDIGRQFACSSRLVLPAGRFGRLMRVAERRLTDVNLKSLLESDYAAPTLAASGIAHVVPIEASEARVIGVAPGTIGLRVDIVAHSFARTAITFQRMVVPPTEHGLMLNFASPESAGNPA